MRKTLWMLAASGLLAATVAGADSDTHIQDARKDLESARAHLKAADHDYGGHRKNALELLNRALDQVDEAAKLGGRHDARDEKKVQQLEHKQQKLENRIEKLKD